MPKPTTIEAETTVHKLPRGRSVRVAGTTIKGLGRDAKIAITRPRGVPVETVPVDSATEKSDIDMTSQ